MPACLFLRHLHGCRRDAGAPSGAFDDPSLPAEFLLHERALASLPDDRQVLILLIHLGLAGDSVELAWQATVLWGLAGGYAANAVLPSLDQLVADRLGREAETS